MFFRGNSFRKKDVNKAVDQLDCLPEAKVKLKNALLEHGRDLKSHQRATGLLSLCLFPQTRKDLETKTENKLNSSAEALKSELVHLPEVQAERLLATVKLIKKDRQFGMLEISLHASLAFSGTLLVYGITTLLSQLSYLSSASYYPSFIPKISLPDWLNSFFSDPLNTITATVVGVGLVIVSVAWHGVKKLLDSEKAAALKRSLRAVLKEMH